MNQHAKTERLAKNDPCGFGKDSLLPRTKDSMDSTNKHIQPYFDYPGSPKYLDPAFSCCNALPPDTQTSAPPYWYYFPGELESFWLAKLLKVVRETNLFVVYRGLFHQPSPQITYVTQCQPGTFTFRATGMAEVFVNGHNVASLSPSAEPHAITVMKSGELKVIITVEDTADDIPALMTVQKMDWLVQKGRQAGNMIEAHVENPLNSGLPPHRRTNPTIPIIPLETQDGLWDARREIMARVEIRTRHRPILHVGESKSEAGNEETAWQEQNTDLALREPDTWISKHQLAFRYLKVVSQAPCDILCHASFPPLAYGGFFNAEEHPRLNEIWTTAAYTLKLCVNHFILDGLKRDRLPWAGDLAISLLAMAYSFGSGIWIRRTLTVLSSDLTKGHDANEIADYSMWLIISHDLYQLYFDDRPFLNHQYHTIKKLVDDLVERYEANRFESLPHSIALIDWGNPPVQHALLMLFLWCLKSARKLARRMDDQTSLTRWHQIEDNLGKWLLAHARNEAGIFYAENPQTSQQLGRHVNMFAILSGLVRGPQARNIAEWLASQQAPEPITPYMAILDILAIARGGLPQPAMGKMEKIWGGMLKLGATSFWEAYDEHDRGTQHFEFYGRKFGKSLCHAWGAGPAFALPMIAFGIIPLEDGWKSFTFHDKTVVRGLTARAMIPTPHGPLIVTQKDGRIIAKAPDGCRQKAATLPLT